MSSNGIARCALGASLFAALMSGAVVAHAQPTRDVSSLFPRRVVVSSPVSSGLVRMPVPTELASAHGGSLESIRITDAYGALRPFMVVDGVGEVAPAAISQLPQTIENYGVERPARGRRTGVTETMTINISSPQIADETRSRTLRFSTALQGPLARDVRVMRADGTVVAQGSLFRLQDGRGQGVLSVALPADASGSLRVRISSNTDEVALEPLIELVTVSHPALAEFDAQRVAPTVARNEEGTSMLFAIHQKPVALRVDANTGFARRWIVVHARNGHGQERVVGQGLFQRFGVAPAASTVPDFLPLDALRDDERELRVQVIDGQDAPLADLSVTAFTRRRSLVFETAGDKATLYLGSERAGRAQYDVQQIAASASMSDAADLRAHLNELPIATLGVVESNPAFADEPFFAFAARAGQNVNAQQFAYRRRIHIENAPEHVTRHWIGPYVRGVASSDLADVRFIDAQGRQWPYLIRDADTQREVQLPISAPTHMPKASRYVLRLPYPQLVRSVKLPMPTQYVNRTTEIITRNVNGQERHLPADNLVADGVVSEIEIPVDERERMNDVADPRITEIVMIVHDGDEAPLRLDHATVEVFDSIAYLFAPPGDYWLVAGNASLTPPQYDVRNMALATSSIEAPWVRADRLERTPGFVAPKGDDGHRTLVWSALIGSVVAMLGIVAWIVRNEPMAQSD